MDVIDKNIFSHTQDGSSNYFEFVVMNQNLSISNDNKDNNLVFETAMKKDVFYTLMYKMMDTKYKYHHKQYRELVIGDVHYHNFKNEEINVFGITTNNVENIDNKFCMLAQQKTKLSILSFPSTMKVYNDNVVRKMTFRVSNRIFVNFEHGMISNGKDDEKFYKVYVNYNHDKDVDVQNAIDTIKNALSILCS
jgi:hypothetical protein